MHVLIPLWHLATHNYFTKYCLAKRYLLVYNRFYKNKSLLEKPSTEGAIKKIIFSSSISLYSYLKIIGWEPGFSKMFSKEKPSCWEQSARKCFIKPELLGSIGDVYKNLSCWEQSEMFTKRRSVGSSRRWRCFCKKKVLP